MFKVELINKKTALKKAEELKTSAFAIAKEEGTLPGYSKAKQCIQYMQLLKLSQLKRGEVCVWINGEEAKLLTDMVTEHGQVIGNICGKEIYHGEVVNSELIIHFSDGVIEYYTYLDEIGAWKYDRNNAKTSFKLPQPSMS